MKVVCVIPARYGSTRFEGKPLAEICGKYMIQRVYEQVKKANLIDEIYIATDDERIMNCFYHIAQWRPETEEQLKRKFSESLSEAPIYINLKR